MSFTKRRGIVEARRVARKAKVGTENRMMKVRLSECFEILKVEHVKKQNQKFWSKDTGKGSALPAPLYVYLTRKLHATQHDDASSC